MKELHNHIFSNTTCISKEIMLKYINKQLSVNELHEVEKHMLDCEFCTDALEGIKYAQNSSMLFAIDNQIDQRVRGGKAKTPIMKNLMVAASLLVIVFGTYFTFNYFTDTVNNDVGIALNNEEDQGLANSKDKIGDEVEADKRGELKEIVQKNQQEDYVTSLSSSTVVIETDEEVAADGDYRVAIEQSPPAPMVEEVMEDEEEIEVLDALVEEEVNELVVSGKLSKVEKEKTVDRRKNEATGGAVGNNNVSNNQSETVAVDANFGFTEDLDDSKDRETLKGEAKKSNNKRSESSNKGKKNRYKSKAPAFAQQDNFADKLEEKTDLANTRNRDNTITLSNFKVVDYTDEYQKEYDLKQVVETKSVSADYETQAEAAEAEREFDETKVEITYKATLEKAMAYYNAKKYSSALEQFNIILNEHPEEVNGLFYGGMSNYHLERFSKANVDLDKVLENPKTNFNEEAEWYKALTLIKLNKNDEAKKLLQKIIDGSGFYKKQANEKLKDL